MVYERAALWGPDGIYYGKEWEMDAFDMHVHALLTEHVALTPQQSDLPCVALDIGCGKGYRAARLARLGVFDEIIACDFADNRHFIDMWNEDGARRRRIGEKVAPIYFLQKDAPTLEPKIFEDKNVVHASMRNVGHFLSPPRFRKTLENIRNVLPANGMAAISFDYVPEGEFTDYLHISDSENIFMQTNAERIKNRKAPYTKYDGADVKGFMESVLGFGVSEEKIRGDRKDFRYGEYHILAFAPAKTLPSPLLRPAAPFHPHGHKKSNTLAL